MRLDSRGCRVSYAFLLRDSASCLATKTRKHEEDLSLASSRASCTCDQTHQSRPEQRERRGLWRGRWRGRKHEVSHSFSKHAVDEARLEINEHPPLAKKVDVEKRRARIDVSNREPGHMPAEGKRCAERIGVLQRCQLRRRQHDRRRIEAKRSCQPQRPGKRWEDGRPGEFGSVDDGSGGRSDSKGRWKPSRRPA